MLKSVYDPNGDGKVVSAAFADEAGSANAVEYVNVANRPTTFPPSSHNHPAAAINDSTPVGRAVLTAADAAAARAAISAGTGNGDLVSGGALGTPASGTLTNCTADGTNLVGYRNIPQNSQSAAYTAVLADAGKHLLHPSADTAARTFTIPANASVAYPIGTALTFVNQNAAGVVTIAITSDTMRLAGAGTTGSRTLAANGIATAIKIAATEWLISGTGLT
jgi:hypothetical protein